MLICQTLGSSVRLLTTFFAFICYGESPRPSGSPLFGQEIHRPHPSYPKGLRFADGLPRPGLRSVEVLLHNDDATLFGWCPWKLARESPRLGNVFLWMRGNSAFDRIWDESRPSTYGYSFAFREGWRDGKVVPRADKASGGTAEQFQFSLRLRGYEFRYANCRSRGGIGLREPATREYQQCFVIEGNLRTVRFYEATTDFVYRDNSLTLKLTGPEDDRVLLHAETRVESRARVVVRWSPETSWYYANVFMGNRASGPGWRVAPKEQNCGEILSLPHWTELNEHIRFRWSRSEP